MNHRSSKRIRRLGAREGYELWAESYDRTPNPVVAMDQRVTPRFLSLRPRARVLDAACGTGRHFETIRSGGGEVLGVDFSPRMLGVARRKYPGVPLVVGDLERGLPCRGRSFDSVLCALVGEHLQDLEQALCEMERVLRPGGRLVFSVYHPEMAAAGAEANFSCGDEEIRLGAVRHTVERYGAALEGAGFGQVAVFEYAGDAKLSATVEGARKYEGSPVLLVLTASRPR